MHINKKDLIEFDNGNMNTQEVIEFLSHLDHCDFCLDQMMEQEDNSTDTAPSYLMEQILDKADSGEVQLARGSKSSIPQNPAAPLQSSDCCRCEVALLLLFSIPNLDFTSLLRILPLRQTEYCPNMRMADSTSSPENSDRTLVMAPVLL